MVVDKKSETHEKDHAHRAESEFKLLARRNKLLGLWAAGELGIEDAAGYAGDVVASDLEEPGDADVVRKVMGDFSAKGVAMTEETLRAKMDELLEEAEAQLAESA